ncbi:PREDICTED: uncharacterized protein LOC105566789 [Vollenhovia emeryi]|uniref:uncharacterized protein LOC105566789 n=1 Tax=Vollenhovia emeryi TaxID=411798 RepID=UPI0005F48136|nr:PREDICTED: uncharacterized protein LOC105566789 [Vollenhovia emeryi]XP_011876465.1 PREDICTED: uncharacterized protein LOC105566789 [Vollenhovia emeryi]
MINKGLETYRTYERFLRTLLKFCGCWYMPTKSGKSTYWWSICVILLMIIYFILSTHNSYVLRHNLVYMMKFVGIAISAIGAVLKVSTFLVNRRSLMNYHRTLNDVFEEELVRNEKIQTIMFSSLPTMCILTYTYAAVILSLFLAFYMPAYLFIIRGLCHFHLTTNYTLPLARGIAHFWTVPDNFLYHFHLFFETVLVIFSSSTACTIDGTFGLYVYQFASTMNAMTFRLVNPLSTDNLSDLLRTCIIKHQKLLQCRDILEHIYGRIIFWHIVTNAILLCSLMYEITTTLTMDVNSITTFLTYALVKLLQTFIYAWCGTVLTNAGDDFRKGIYFGGWPNSDLDCHLRTKVILMMMQKPMTINAFVSPVDIAMFTRSVNTTMSYYFLLQSIGDKG